MEKLKTTDLKDALASAEAERESLRARLEALDEWIEVTRRLCSKPSRHTGTQEVPNSRRTRTSDLAIHVLEVLKRAGSPMHVNDIVAALAQHGHPVQAKNPAATVAVALGRRPEQFRKAAPNTFGIAFTSEPIGIKAVTMVS